MESLREARQCCERALSQIQAPGTPRQLASTTLCAAPGRRRIRLEWQAPECWEDAPVRRFLVAALDPSYGRALTITVLEPEYSEELKRFVSIEELNSYTLAQEDLAKMPSFFRQSVATVQVAAENEAGQSSWAILRVSLREAATPAAAGLASEQEHLPQGDQGKQKTGASCSSKSRGRDAAAGNLPARKFNEFEAEAKALAQESAVELCDWLRKQSKGLLVAWLKSKSWSTTGSKENLVDRVAFILGGNR